MYNYTTTQKTSLKKKQTGLDDAELSGERLNTA